MIDPAIIDLMHHMARTPAAIERPAGPAWTAADVDSGEVTVQGIERELEEWAEAANSQVVRLADALRRAGASPERLHRLDQMIEAFEGTVGQDAVSYRRLGTLAPACPRQPRAGPRRANPSGAGDARARLGGDDRALPTCAAEREFGAVSGCLTRRQGSIMAGSGEKKSGPILQWGPTEAALAKAGLNLIPFVGAFSELLTVFIPTQRKDRIEHYLHALGMLLDKMDEDEFKKKLETPEAIDLFEEGGFQTVRAISDERKGYIAQIVANGLAGDKIAQIRSKRLLKLLAEIDDTQIIILSSKLNSNMFDDNFFEKHSSILSGPSVHMSSALPEVEAAALYEAGRSELLRLGLLKTNYSIPKKGELPSFDEKTGTLKSQSSYLTTLGRMLLKNIGISEAEKL